MRAGRVRKVTEKMHFAVTCTTCGDLDPPTDAAARRHAHNNPTHEVGMTWVAQASYFVRPSVSVEETPQ